MRYRYNYSLICDFIWSSCNFRRTACMISLHCLVSSGVFHRFGGANV